MPTTFPEPSILRLRKTFANAVRGRMDRYADTRQGAVLDHFAGVGAMMWSRLARRDTDMWRAIYLDSAEGSDLTRLLNDRFAFERIPDAYGTGTASLSRPTTAAGAGTIWKGTRVRLVGPRIIPAAYIVTQDTPVAATDAYARVPVRAEHPGPGHATVSTSARVDDPLWDATWTVARLECGEGTAFESAGDSRARFRDGRLDGRVGFRESIEKACIAAGATYAVAFQSDYAGDVYDFGLNHVYVGDVSYNGSADLVRRVRIALEDARVLGDNIQVLPMVRTSIAIAAKVYLWDSPGRVNQAALARVLRSVVLDFFAGERNGFAYNREAIGGAWLKASSAVQYVEFTAPTADSNVVATSYGTLNFPAALARYVLRAEDVTTTFHAAQ